MTEKTGCRRINYKKELIDVIETEIELILYLMMNIIFEFYQK